MTRSPPGSGKEIAACVAMWAESVKSVVTGVPSTAITDDAVNAAPTTEIVADEPALTLVGEMDVMDGIGAVTVRVRCPVSPAPSSLTHTSRVPTTATTEAGTTHEQDVPTVHVVSYG